MSQLRIAVVEDEVLTAESIAIYLNRMGHEVVATYARYEVIFSQLPTPLPDLFLVDIRLKGSKTGLDVARELNARIGVPFLFLTSHTDSKMVRMAMETSPTGYVTKPFSYEDLFIGIELAKAKLNLKLPQDRRIKIKSGPDSEWVSLNDVHYLEADRSYVTVHLANTSVVLRQSMGSLLEEFEPSEMVRIHRSFAVNPRNVHSISARKVVLGSKRLPMGPGYRAQFQQIMRSLNG